MKPLEGKRPKAQTVLFAMAAMVVVAVTLFRVPLATVFTLGVLLICPLLMVGMHRGGHGVQPSGVNRAQTDPTDRTSNGAKRVGSTLPSSSQALGSSRSATEPSRRVAP